MKAKIIELVGEVVFDKPTKPKSIISIPSDNLDSTSVSLWCERGKHHFTREVKKGRRPKNCPLHAKTNYEIKSEEVIDLVKVNEEIADLENKIPGIVLDYEKQLDKAVNNNDNIIWRRLTNLQKQIINMEARRRYLKTL